MVDKLTPDRRSRNMAAIGSKNTKPEFAVRRLLHRLGYHYRRHARGLPGKPDLVFSSRRAVISVHGCSGMDMAARGAAPVRNPTSPTGDQRSPVTERVMTQPRKGSGRLVGDPSLCGNARQPTSRLLSLSLLPSWGVLTRLLADSRTP